MKPNLTYQAVARNVAGAPVELAGLESHLHVDLVTGAAGYEFAIDSITGAGCWIQRKAGEVIKVGVLSGAFNEGEDQYTEDELEQGIAGIVRVRLTTFRPAA